MRRTRPAPAPAALPESPAPAARPEPARSAVLARLAALAALAVLAAGCSSGAGPHGGAGSAPTTSASQLAPPLATCGTTRTAANVPVIVEVEKGSAACSLAMRIQRGYTDLVRAGQVGGNGGGAPVRVSGWTCQGEDTPTIVATGEASNCRKGQTEIVAVLNLQSQPSGSGTAG